MLQLPVHEKFTVSGKMGRTKRVQVSDIPVNENVISKQAKHTRGLVAAATAAISNDRRREKENMADFILKKREMFLVQMSLDTKREEIRKLEEKAQMKEEALKKGELMLEEDAIRFDTFLKENDKKAHEAIKRAESETKAKQDKVQEIKKLNQQIQQVQSEMSKLKEQLEDCLRYKTFLDSLTPSEYFEEQKALIRKRKEEKREKRKAEIMAEYEEKKQRAIEEYERAKQAAASRDQRSGLKKKKGAGKAELRLPPPPKFNSDEFKDSENDDENEEIPIYFKESTQLLDIFTQLEESNLFLIQNSQETEQALEELKQEFRETKRRMDKKTKVLKQNIDELQLQIREEERKAAHLRDRRHLGTGEDAQESLLKQLNTRVREVYRKCGFDDSSNPATLTMLTDLEAKLEDLLSQIEAMPEEYVVKAEKMKEKDRRERVRAERMAQQQQLYEERLAKSMARSMQAPKKKTGKQVMFRSAPPKLRVKKKNDEDQEDEDKDAEFFKW